MSEVHAANQEHLVPISAKVPSELADAVSRLADAGDRSVSREVARAIREHVNRSGEPFFSRSPESRVERRAPEEKKTPAVKARPLAGP
jgi:hypothetical protein